MRLFLRILIVSLLMTLSQASMSATSHSTTTTATTKSSVKTATKNESMSARFERISKPKLLRSNPYRASYFLFADTNEDIEIDDDYKISGHREQDLNKIVAPSTPDDPFGEVSEDIRYRLALARQRALERYDEIYRI